MKRLHEINPPPMPLVPTIVVMAVLWIAFFCAALLPQKAQAQTLDQNTYAILLPSGARTATPTIPDQGNFTWRCVDVVLNVTANPGAQTLTLAVNGKDPVSGAVFALLTGATVSGNSVNVYTICPGVTVAANVTASTFLPALWQVTVTHSAAGSWTYSVSALLSK